MPSTRRLAEAERQASWTEVPAEFPDDETMQEVHFVRALRAAQLRDLTPDQRVEYLNQRLSQSPPRR